MDKVTKFNKIRFIRMSDEEGEQNGAAIGLSKVIL